jgi:hypothetical protein
LQKVFPADATLDELIDFFEQFGKTEQIQMRKNANREFKVRPLSSVIAMVSELFCAGFGVCGV